MFRLHGETLIKIVLIKGQQQQNFADVLMTYLGLGKELKSCHLKAVSLVDPFCVDAGWHESVSTNTLEVQMTHFLLLVRSGIMSMQLCQTSVGSFLGWSSQLHIVTCPAVPDKDPTASWRPGVYSETA